MFVVLLRFSNDKTQAAPHMDGHKQWLARGFADGVFLMAGSLQPRAGGAIVAHGLSLEALRARVDEDPFVVHDVVRAEILEITPSRADERLQFLLEGAGA